MIETSCDVLRRRITRLTSTRQRLSANATTGSVLAAIADEAREFCEAGRAVVFAVHGDHLTVDPCEPLLHASSDALRRRALALRPRLDPESVEAAVLRKAAGVSTVGPTRTSVLASSLNLDRPETVALGAEGRAVALLVLDRPCSGFDPAVVALYQHVAEGALDQVLRRARQQELMQQLRYLTSAAEALGREALDSPLSITVDAECAAMLRVDFDDPADEPAWLADLNARELEVLEHLAEGESNRQIAEALHLSAETVKGYVSRLLPKLGAANRVEAAKLFLTTNGSSRSPRSGLPAARVAR